MLFIYRDSNGIITKRKLGNHKDDGTYLHGYCEYSQGVRLFKKDRILQEFSENDNLTEFHQTLHPNDVKDYKIKRSKEKVLEICFSGIFSRPRKELQEKARNNNMIVRGSVTKNLNFLCIGHRVGPVKIKKAEDQGVCPLTEDEFHQLIETGQMPEGWIDIGGHTTNKEPKPKVEKWQENPELEQLPDGATAEQKIQHLEYLIRKHDYNYFVIEEPEIADSGYDRLKRELAWLKEKYPKSSSQ